MAHTGYADVRYPSEGRWIRHWIVPIAEGEVLEEGQVVYFNQAIAGKGWLKPRPPHELPVFFALP